MLREVSDSSSGANGNNIKLFHYFSDSVATLLFCVVGGFMDASGYIKLLGLFTTSMTGNLIVAATTVYKPSNPSIARAIVSIAFTLAAYMATNIGIRLRIVEEYSLRVSTLVLISITIANIAMAMIAGLVLDEVISTAKYLNEMPIVLVGSLMSASMGVHSATVRESLPRSPATGVMTTNLVTIALNAAVCTNYFLARHNILRMTPRRQSRNAAHIEEKFAATSKKLYSSTKPLVVFILGAVLGTIVTYNVSFFSLCVPMGLLALLVADISVGLVVAQRRRVRHEEPIDEIEATRSLDPELGLEDEAVAAAGAITNEEQQGQEVSGL